jgi:hypothetical protein
VNNPFCAEADGVSGLRRWAVSAARTQRQTQTLTFLRTTPLANPNCSFVTSAIRKMKTPDGLIKFWLGHQDKDMTDRHDLVKEDVQFRQRKARSLSLGFDLPKTLMGQVSKRFSPEPIEVSSGVIGRGLQTALELVN